MSESNDEKTQAAINQEIHQALYGISGNPGIIQKTNEVWEILSAFRLFGKLVMWIALFLGSVGTAVAGYFQLVKHLFKAK